MKRSSAWLAIQDVFDIVRHLPENRRRIYAEPEPGVYDERYYLSACSGHDSFRRSEGGELDSVRAFALSLVPLGETSRLLDIGCGRGEIVRAASERGVRRAVGIDLSPDGAALARKTCAGLVEAGKVEILEMDATALRFGDGEFDVCLMTDIVEHLTDDRLRRAIAEAHRVLRPGGRLVVHTMPSISYKIAGQYLVKAYFRFQGREWWTPTTAEESRLTHVNIQSKRSLSAYLRESFGPKIRVFEGPSRRGGALKKAIGALGLWRVLSPHLWAVAVKG